MDKGTVRLEEREGGEVRSKMRLQKEAGASPGQASEARSECLKNKLSSEEQREAIEG